MEENKDVIATVIQNGCKALPGVMSAACGAGDVEIVEMLAKAWEGQPGCAIGGQGMEAVIDRKNKEMFMCIVRNQLLSKVAAETIAMRLGMT